MDSTRHWAATLMVQGTSSSSGKSLLVTALCRIFARRGLRVAPFKAQNMSNNAAVCPDGSEIGRAQAVQAMAAGIEPSAAMNPILLKPEADARSQVVLNGRAWRTLSAREYYQHKGQLWSAVSTALDRLRTEYELVIIEGAGSPVELNLKAGDLVNMVVARYAAAPVVLVGDIDRGGIFAQLLGTLWLLTPEERALVRGLVVNKFRGDQDLFADGVRLLEERGGVPVLGVVPFVNHLAIPDEDAVAIEDRKYLLDEPDPKAQSSYIVDIAVIKLPHIANFDDFDALINEAGVRLRYVTAPDTLGQPHAVILPGTKSTMADLNWLREQRLTAAIQHLAANGVSVVGICGGYQMLGQVICDPEHYESPIETTPGLGLLPLTTVFSRDKATHQAEAEIGAAPGWLLPLAGQTVRGYEIHMGRTTLTADFPGSGGCQTWLRITQRSGESADVQDGAISPDGRVWGCYLHGLFDNDHLRHAWLRSLGWDDRAALQSSGFDRWAAFDRLADVVEAALNMPRLEAIIWGEQL